MRAASSAEVYGPPAASSRYRPRRSPMTTRAALTVAPNSTTAWPSSALRRSSSSGGEDVVPDMGRPVGVPPGLASGPPPRRPPSVPERARKLAVRRAEVDVAVAVVLGRLVDLDARGPQLAGGGLEVGDEEADRARGLAHLARPRPAKNDRRAGRTCRRSPHHRRGSPPSTSPTNAAISGADRSRCRRTPDPGPPSAQPTGRWRPCRPRRTSRRRRASASTSAASSGRPPSAMRAAAVSSAMPSAAISAAAASWAGRCRCGPSSRFERVGHGVLELAAELQPARADGRDLAREPELEDELGLEPARQLAQPRADGRDRVLARRRSASVAGQRTDGGRAPRR